MSLLARANGARAAGRRPLHSALRAALAVGAVFSGAVLLLAACSSGSAKFGSGAAGQPAAAPAQNAAHAPASGTARRPTGTKLVLSSQSIIYTAQLTLRVRQVTAVATEASSLAIAAGGYVAGEQEIIPHSNHATPLVSLELKIPVAQYHAVLAKLATLGRQVSFTQHAQDVTQQVADVSGRVASAQAAIRQLRALLSKAGSVGQLLQVQEEINVQESSLEALLAQQQALSHETSYGTVTVTLLGHQVVIHKKPKKKKTGFGTGLTAGWNALVLVVRWLLTALGAVLPFAIPVAVLALIGLEGRRRLSRRRTPPAAEPPAAAQT